MRLVKVLLGCAAAVSSVHAEIKELGSVRVTVEMGDWNEKLNNTGLKKENSNGMSPTGYTECSETVEIPGAFLCGSYYQDDMNYALGRASVFVEGLSGIQAGTVVRHDNPSLGAYLPRIGGHDLKGSMLMKFYRAVTKACSESNNDVEVCLNSREKELFEEFILPKYKLNPDFVLITWSIVGSMGWDEVVTHEIMHAQYFLEPAFQKVVDDFWQNDVLDSDKAKIKARLISVGYGVDKDELLLKNEFQAYMLMARASGSQLRAFVPLYRDELFKAMKSAGVNPVQVN